MAQSHSSRTPASSGAKPGGASTASGGHAPDQNLPGGGKHSPAAVTHYLKDIEFPATREELLTHARRNGASREVMQELEDMRAHRFATMADVMKAFGKTH